MSRFIIEHCPINPTLEYAESIIPPEGTTEIISRGGGSTIDIAKWIAKKYKLRHTAIPTTAGTGSEVTPFVVLMVDGKKKTFTDEKYIPDAYILDPLLVTSLPPLQTISTGLDALSQSLESMWSKSATEESMAYATLGMVLVLKSLKRCLESSDDTNARMDLLMAANMSGRAIAITRTNVCHAISYPLTEWYNIPHGIACGMSLGYFAQRWGFKEDINGFIKSVLPKYKIDKKRVAKEVIKSEKLGDCTFSVTEMDIFKSLV